MTRLWLAVLAAALAWALSASAEPAAQAAFRAVLVKYDAKAAAETDIDRLQALEAQRAAELAEVLGTGLRFDGWELMLSGWEATPTGGIFVRLLDPQLLTFKAVRPTFWNSGPGVVVREAEIPSTSPLHASVALLKREALVVVSGHFFRAQGGGPLYESAGGGFQALSNQRARFRLPYFSIAIEAIDALFPERHFP